MGNIAKGTKVEFEFVFGRENIPDPPKTGRIYFVYDPDNNMQAIQVGNDGELLELASVYSDQDFAEDFTVKFRQFIADWKVKDTNISGSNPSTTSYIADAMFDSSTGVLVLTRKNLTSQLSPYAKLSGATFTGNVMLAGDPTSNLQAATKQYVDSRVSTALKYLGISSTVITNGGSQSPTINGTVITPQNGNIVYYEGVEFIFNGTVWQVMGSPSGDIPKLAGHTGETPKFTSDGALDTSGYAIASSTPMGKFFIPYSSSKGDVYTDPIPVTWDNTYPMLLADRQLKNGGIYLMQTSHGWTFKSNPTYFSYPAGSGATKIFMVVNCDTTHTLDPDEVFEIAVIDADNEYQVAMLIGGGRYWANTKSGAYRDTGLTFSVSTLKNSSLSSPIALGSLKNTGIDVIYPRALSIYDVFYIQYDGSSQFKFNSSVQYQYVSYTATNNKTYTIRISGIDTNHYFVQNDVIGIYIAGEIGQYENPVYYGHVISQSWKTTFTNTTYTFAEGTTDGAFSVTPSTGSARSVPIHGLKQGAFQNNVTLCVLESMTPVAGVYTITKANEVGPRYIWQEPMIGEIINICCANAIADTFIRTEVEFDLESDATTSHLRISNIDINHLIVDGDVFAVIVYDIITEDGYPVYLCRQYAQSWKDYTRLTWGTLS